MLPLRETKKRKKYSNNTEDEERSLSTTGYDTIKGHWECDLLPVSFVKEPPSGPELKDMVNTQTLVSTTTGNVQTGLFNIAQGINAAQRTGRRIRIVRIEFDLLHFWDPQTLTEIDTAQTQRVMLVMDKQNNSALAPAITDILLPLIPYGVTAPTNLDNKYRFEVLFDNYWTPCFKYGTATKPFPMVKKVPRAVFDCNLPVLYSSSTGLSSATSINFCLIGVANRNSSNRGFVYQSRFFYFDD